MNKLFLLLLTLLTVTVNAQMIRANRTISVLPSYAESITYSGDTLIVCGDTTIDKSYYKDTVKCTTTTTAKTCYDTTIINKTCYDTTYSISVNCKKTRVSGWWFWSKYETRCDTIRKQIITSYLCPYKVISSYSCPIISTKCDTSKIYVPYFETITICDTTYPPSAIEFGAKVQDGTSDEQIEVLNKLGVNAARPVSIEVSTYIPGQKPKRLVEFYNAGVKSVINLNWLVGDAKKPYGFCKDLTLYRKKIQEVLKDNAPMIEWAIIENEPSNDGYYGATVDMNDYLNLLKVAIEECHKAGIKVADGCLHIEAITGIMSGVKTTNKTIIDQKILLAGYAYLDLDAVNVHKVIKGDERPAAEIKAACDYITAVTGLPVISNEWHGEKMTTAALESAVQGWKDAKVILSIIWSGGGSSPADAINSGTSLTPLGVTYGKAIKQ